MVGGLYCVTGGSKQNHPKEKDKQEGRVLIWEALQIAKEKNEKQGRKGKVHPTKYRVPKNSIERQEGLQWIMHKTRRKQQKGKD